MSYRIMHDIAGTVSGVERLADGIYIQPDAGNADWRAYLDWRAAGNTPEPAPRLAPPDAISDRQFFQGLAQRGLISEAEALTAAGRGEIPARLEQAIAALPEAERFAARMAISGAVTFHRSSPITAALAANLGMNAADLDDLWRFCAAL